MFNLPGKGKRDSKPAQGDRSSAEETQVPAEKSTISAGQKGSEVGENVVVAQGQADAEPAAQQAGASAAAQQVAAEPAEERARVGELAEQQAAVTPHTTHPTQEFRERWDHRADLAYQAVYERHASRLWGIPRTTLGIIAWPPTTRDRLFVRWHYWWQAHYIDNLIDAAVRRPTTSRIHAIRRHLRAMRIRNISRLSVNNYYDDKAWLALALQRAANEPKISAKLNAARDLEPLVENIFEGVDSLTGVLPWRTNETFYNVPTNGPAAILAARNGDIETAERLVDWTFDNLINEDGLVMDGIHMRMAGPEPVTALHPYCQGVMLGACVELARARRRAAGVGDEEVSDVGVKEITRIHGLLRAIENHMTDHDGAINVRTGGGDGGLFNGILARYLSLVVECLPTPGRHGTESVAIARRIVLATAEQVWRFRLEVDGLPVFSADWTKDATMPQAGGLVGATIAGAVASSDIAERDLSVQLSGWMLMEAAARVSAAGARVSAVGAL
ncbi:glycoside hydrolase family 76 protein [Corynebacterium macclintockiae]|uniref:glycoside hydrolase family 76 protein n=1 Tax=Corynebacterium macclintockiae TaxID=2913501 RepID=UPI003EC0EA68